MSNGSIERKSVVDSGSSCWASRRRVKARGGRIKMSSAHKRRLNVRDMLDTLSNAGRKLRSESIKQRRRCGVQNTQKQKGAIVRRSTVLWLQARHCSLGGTELPRLKEANARKLTLSGSCGALGRLIGVVLHFGSFSQAFCCTTIMNKKRDLNNSSAG